MISDTKKLTARAALAVALYSLATYIFAHLAYIYMNTDTGMVFELISLYLSKITVFVIPAALFALTVIIYASQGIKKSIIFALAASSARLIYSLPYYYIIFIYNYGYDSIESILLSLVACVAVIAFTVLGIFASLGIALLILKKDKSRKKELSLKAYLAESLNARQSVSDFTKGANLALLVCSLFSFLCALIPEIIDTVSFFIEYKLDYTIPELITIMCNYILLLIMIFASYILAVYIKNKAVKEVDSLRSDV